MRIALPSNEVGSEITVTAIAYGSHGRNSSFTQTIHLVDVSPASVTIAYVIDSI